MVKEYQSQDVYEALQERFHFLFQEFENIYISFSGGKDSGLLLNLLLDFRDEYYPSRSIGLFHQDFEAQYTVTTEYVERTFQRLQGKVEPYWVCLPMATRTALSSYEMYWYPWDDTKKEIWVRPMPEYPAHICLGVYAAVGIPCLAVIRRILKFIFRSLFCRQYHFACGKDMQGRPMVRFDPCIF